MSATLAPAEEDALVRYLEELSHLSEAARLELISRLAQSLRADPIKDAPASRIQLSGTWADNGESAEELAAQIRRARHLIRP